MIAVIARRGLSSIGKPGCTEFWLYLLLAPVLYLAFALVTPPFQTPDEHQHLFRAWQLAEGQLVGTREGERSGGELPVSLSMAAAKEIGTAEPHTSGPRPRPDRGVAESARTRLASSPRQFTNFLGSVLYPPTSYVPQIVSIWLGRAAGLSVETIVRLGRVLNASLAIVLMAFAILLAPFGKRVLLIIGLMPMTASCAASLGQDGLIIGACSLMIALALRRWIKLAPLRFEGISAALLAVATLMGKPVYLPLTVLSLRPFHWRGGERRRNVATIFGVSLAFGLIVCWRILVAHLEVPAVAGVPPAGMRLAEWAHDPSIVFATLRATAEQRGMVIVGTLATFGWMDIGPVSGVFWILLLTPIFLLVTGESDGIEPGSAARAWLALMAIATGVLISLATFLMWTPAGSPLISGLQGRYFIPPLTALLIAGLPRRSLIPRGWPVAPALIFISNLAALQAIHHAYYQ